MEDAILKFNRAIEEGEKEADRKLELLIEDLKKKLQTNDVMVFIELLISSKHRFLKANKSIYSIIYKNDKISTTANHINWIVSFYEKELFFNMNPENHLKVFKGEVVEWNIAKRLYDFLLQAIYEINNDLNSSFKLPKIENFEVDFFRLIWKENNESKKNYNTIKELYDSQIKEKDDELFLLQKDKTEINFENSDLKREKKDLEFEYQLLEKKFNYVFDYVNTHKEAIYVNQFDNLIWGDNYPALKLLYKFFYSNQMVDFNWSTFCNYFQEENTECFNLNIQYSNFSKNDIGYLLYKLHPFFKNKKIARKQDYKHWLCRKIFIDNKIVTIKSANKYIRGFDTNKDELQAYEAIDKLVFNINKCYI